MQFKRRRELKRTRIEIIPMIDTIFFLLVFFMLSSLALTRVNGLNVNLPKASTATRQPKTVSITITKERRIYVDAQPVALAALGSALSQNARRLGTDMSEASVVINADLSVPHGIVVSCMDESRKAGISHFSIATVPEEQIGRP